MADAKISALTTASALAGTEVLPIVQSGSTKKVATDDLTVKNIRSNATTGLLQIAGPGTGTTRTMTVPNANFTAARTDASQTFTDDQVFSNGLRINGTSSVFAPGTISFDYPTTRHYTGDGTGYSWAVSKRTGGADVNLLAIDEGTSNVTVNLGNLVQGTAAKGVNFTANTGAAGMTSQLLNWYEEGTWTGGVSFGSATTGITYNNTLGYYTRVGNLVTVSGYINLSNKGSATGAARITGLPFTCANNAAAYAAPALFFSNLTYLGQVTAYVNINGTTIDLFQTTEAGTASALTDTNFSNNTQFILNLTYRAA